MPSAAFRLGADYGLPPLKARSPTLIVGLALHLPAAFPYKLEDAIRRVGGMIKWLNRVRRAYRIYIVEDSAILLRLLIEMLGGIAGAFVVGHSAHAEQAILEIPEAMPDAIIVDLMLTTGTGYEVMKALRHQCTTMPVVIVLTNLTMAPHPTWAASLGATYFFDKSTEIVKMFRVIDELVKAHRGAAIRI
jgi:CheY-like chemotaxis protein